MNLKKIIITTLLLSVTGFFFAQDADIKPEISLDSLKTTFITHHNVTEIDDFWIKELTNNDIYEQWSQDLQNLESERWVDFELPTELFKERLELLDQKSMFSVEHNQIIESVTKSYLKNRKDALQRLMALSEYYFPLFEEKLAKYNLPLELKYLAIVESALNPRAVSRMGASGLWQFMFYTGKMYNLEVNTYIDERYDPIKSTEAACQYLSSLYDMYKNWELALAAYNAGPGNVNKAIRRSGGLKNYWIIRKNLPRETQGYLPSFLATMYIFEYSKEHNIVPNKIQIQHHQTDTIHLKRKMSFQQISDLVDISIDEIRFMNPTYKHEIIPFSSQKPYYLRLPIEKAGVFASNEDKIYAYVDAQKDKLEKFLKIKEREALATRYHTIKKGENLGSIARKYGVSVSNLKRWNNIAGTTIRAGKKLKIM